MSNEKMDKMLTFVWKIENVSSCYQVVGEGINSPEFEVEFLSGTRWYLRFHPKSVHFEGYTNLYLWRTNLAKNYEEILVDYEIAISTVNDTNLKTFERKHLNLKEIRQSDHHCLLLEELDSALENCDKDVLSISCAFYATNPTGKKAIVHAARSKIGINPCSFPWNVKKPDNLNWIQSIKCPFPDICPIEVTLTSPQEDVIINIRLLDENPHLPQFVTGKIVLLDTKGTERDSKSDKRLFSSANKSDIWNFPFQIKTREFKREKDIYLKNGIFTLMCYFTSSYRIYSMETAKYMYEIPVDTPVPPSYVNRTSALVQDLAVMLNNQDHSDVKLRIGSDEFPAHKVILASRSPVFFAMFKRDMVETQTGFVDISDIDVNTLKFFLEYLYTDSVDKLDYEGALKLLIAANKYQVESLKEKCSSFLVSVMSVENVCAILLFADMVEHQLLKKVAMDYIKAHTRKILPSSEWGEVIKKNCSLASEVLFRISEKSAK